MWRWFHARGVAAVAGDDRRRRRRHATTNWPPCVERAFGAWAPAAPRPAPSLDVRDAMTAPAPPAPSLPLALVDRPRAAQSELRIGQVAAPRLTPDYYPLLVLNAILGGQFVSRLNMNLREDKGYTYGVRSGFEFRRAPGPFVVQAAVQTAVTADAVREVLAEVRDIASVASGHAGGTRPGEVGADARLRPQLRDGRPDRARARTARPLRTARRHARTVRLRRPGGGHRRGDRRGAVLRSLEDDRGGRRRPREGGAGARRRSGIGAGRGASTTE